MGDFILSIKMPLFLGLIFDVSTIEFRVIMNFVFLNFKCIIEIAQPGEVVHTYNPRTLGVPGGCIMRSGVQDQPGKYGETPSLLKIQKLARCSDMHL